MKGMDEFLNLFGNITVLQIVGLIFACVFLFSIYKKVKDYLIKKHELEKEKDVKAKPELTIEELKKETIHEMEVINPFLTSILK